MLLLSINIFCFDTMECSLHETEKISNYSNNKKNGNYVNVYGLLPLDKKLNVLKSMMQYDLLIGLNGCHKQRQFSCISTEI